ncbi:MAG: hypothetical protein BM560_17700 [Roseobacter sp. MedPE-SWde]|nr:MAG: hypothetical protein BM560_17700 [Roseobacter sp. MedPE-SWde]
MNIKYAALAFIALVSLAFVWVWFFVKSIEHSERLLRILPRASNIEIVHQTDTSARVPLEPWCNDLRGIKINRQNLCRTPVKVNEFTAAAQCKPASVFLRYRFFPFTGLQAIIFTQGDASGLEKVFQSPPSYMALPNTTILPRAPFDKLSRADAYYLKASKPRQVGYQDCGAFQVYQFNL